MLRSPTTLLATPIVAMVLSPHASAQFVEPATILQEWQGEAAGDQFGWVARRIGDVDGDGVLDCVSTAPTNAAGGEKAGHIYMYSSKSGKLLWTATGKVGAQLGTSCDAAGDINADGVPDVLCGAVGIGEAYVYSGDDGRVLLMLKAKKQSDVFGWGLSTVGDWNGDGHDDFIIGARGADEGGEDAGAVYLYSGKDGSVMKTLTGKNPGDFFGSELSGYSDGENYILAIGAMKAGESNRGRVFVYTGQESKGGFVIDAAKTGAGLGSMFVTIFGDADGDNVPDIYASDWNDGAKGRNTGRVYIYSTRTGKIIYEWEGDAAGIGFGIGASDVGDIDGDVRADLLIGAWNESSGSRNAGKCYLYSGKSGEIVRTITCNIANDTFGFDTTHVGDVDGDGVNDFLITSAWATIDGDQKRGRVFIISGATP